MAGFAESRGIRTRDIGKSDDQIKQEAIERERLIQERQLKREVEEEDELERRQVTFREGDAVRLKHGLNPSFLLKFVPEFEKLRRLLKGIGVPHAPFLMSH